MTLSAEDTDMAVRIVKRMVSNGASGTKHHQIQTIAGWFRADEQGYVKDVLDDMVSDRSVPVRQKGRKTVTLVSLPLGLQFLEEHGVEDPRGW